MDYMLIPYDSTMYRLSASGVFFDSINYEIPALMLDSPLLTFYEEKYGLGKCYADVKRLINRIIDIIESTEEINAEKQEKVRVLKQKLNEENVSYVKDFMN